MYYIQSAEHTRSVSLRHDPKFWLSVMTELKNRGLQDIFIACSDGLKGFPEVIEAVYPQLYACASVSPFPALCGLERTQNGSGRDQRTIYNAVNLEAFAAKWDEQYPTISQSWKKNWAHLIVTFDFTPEIRKAIYTTNAIESLNASRRKATKTRRLFPTDESVLKLLYLALHNISGKWTMPIRDWKPAMSQFMLIYGDRVTLWRSGLWPFTQKILQAPTLTRTVFVNSASLVLPVESFRQVLLKEHNKMILNPFLFPTSAKTSVLQRKINSF